MVGRYWVWGIALLAALGGFSGEALGQTREERTVSDAILVFDEIMSIRDEGIPREMLKDAHAVAIIPNVLKGSFVLGARFGHGLLLVRDERGAWHAPVFVTLAGGNVGWQVGVQATDVILVFKTRKSVEGLLDGKVTLGGDVAVAAGPIGRQAAAATDTRLGAEIYSYSRSRGLFAGVSFDGSSIKVDPNANAAYYRPASFGGPVVVPEPAQQLVAKVLDQTGVLAEAAVSNTPVAPVPQERLLREGQAQDEASKARDELARVAPKLYELLDPTWQEFLGLPVQVFHGGEHPKREDLIAAQGRFDTVRQDARYRALSERAEFQQTAELLKKYVDALSANADKLQLPAPPGVGR